MMYVRMGQVAALEEGCRRGRVEVQSGEEKQTPYGVEEQEFLAHLQDADPEH